MQNTKRTIMCNLMLITAAAIWGGSFIFQKMAAAEIGAFTFMAARYGTGSISLLILIAYMEYHRRSADKLSGVTTPAYGKAYFKKLFIVAPLCSFANFMGNVLVQMGLEYTTASKAGFINSIYIVFLPVVGFLFFKLKSGPKTFLAIILAVIGLYNLCMKESLTIEKGDLIILSATFLFALHIHLVSKYVREMVGVHFSCAEFVFATFVCGIIALIFEEPTFEQLSACSVSILYSGVLGVGVCYALQVTAQKHVDPTIAGLLMSLESVFSAVLGVIFLNESFTAKELVGIAFIVAAIIISQLPEKKKLSETTEEQAS